MNYDSIRHQLDCRLHNSSADTTSLPGFRVYPKPSNFSIPLVPGHNVVIPPATQPITVTQTTIAERIVQPTSQHGTDRGRLRLRWTGWAKNAFGFISDLCLATAQFPRHFIPYYSNPKSASVSQGGSSCTPCSAHCSSLSEHEHDLAAAGDGPEHPDHAPGLASSTFCPRRGINDPERTFEQRCFDAESEHEPDLRWWIWYYYCGCAHRVNGCSARMVIGQRYDSPGVLSVRFYGYCVHQENGKPVGRLSGSMRALVASRALAMGNRQAHDLALKEAPTEHHLDGVVSTSGSSIAVIRKAASEARLKGAGLHKVNMKGDQLLQAMAVASKVQDDDETSMADSPLKKHVLAYGFEQLMLRQGGAFVMGMWLEFSAHVWAGVRRDGVVTGVLFDATAQQVDSYCGNKTYSSFLVSPHPAGVQEPFRRGDQVPQQIVLAVLAHTLLTAAYVRAFFDAFFGLVARVSESAKPTDGRPCHKDYLPAFLLTDHDTTIMKGACLSLNLCLPSSYANQMHQLCQSFLDSVVKMGSKMMPVLPTQELISMPFRELLKLVQQVAKLTDQDKQQHQTAVQQFAGEFVTSSRQQQVEHSLAAVACGVQGSSSPATQPQSDAEHHTPLEYNAKQLAVAALLCVAKISWFVHLKLCSWHWIKAWKEYAHRGKHFKDRPLAERMFKSWLLGVVLGHPAVQTRFRGLHRVALGKAYLKGVMQACSISHLLAHPQEPVQQLGGLVTVRPATDADIKMGSAHRGKPSWVVVFNSWLTHGGKPVQIRYYGDAVIAADWDCDDAPVVDPEASAEDCEQYKGGGECDLPVLDSAPASLETVIKALCAKSKPGMVLILNPVKDDGMVACAQRVYSENLDLMAFPYVDELHDQLSNIFVQTDGRPPAWARTHRNSGLTEATIKHNKHTQGGGEGPVSLASFFMRQYELAKGQALRYYQSLRLIQHQKNTVRFVEGLAKRRAKWFSSPESMLVVPPESCLIEQAAHQVNKAQTMPTHGINMNLSNEDRTLASCVLGTGMSSLEGSAGLGSSRCGPTDVGASVMQGTQPQPITTPGPQCSTVGGQGNEDMPWQESETAWGPPGGWRSKRNTTPDSQVEFVVSETASTRPRRAAAAGVRKLINRIEAANKSSLRRAPELTGRLTSARTTLIDGSAVTVRLGDVVAVRTDAHDRYTFDSDLPGVPWGMYIFEVTKLQIEDGEGLKGYGRFYSNRSRSLDKPVSKCRTIDKAGLPLHGCTVSVIAAGHVKQLDSKQRRLLRDMVAK